MCIFSHMPYYILFSRSGNEEDTLKHLKRRVKDLGLGIEFKIMKREMVNIKNGAKLLKTYNALPGYIFVKSDDELCPDTIARLLSPSLVFYFLHYHDGSIMLQRDDEKFAIGVFELPKVITSDNVFIRNGDTVEIVSGAFTAIRGRILKVDRRRSRVDVAISFMEKEMKLTLPFNDVAVRNDEGKSEKEAGET